MRSLLLTLLLLAPVAATAQSDQEGRQVKCRFLCFGADSRPKDIQALGPDGERIPVDIPISRISAPITLKAADNKIPFVTSGSEEVVGTAKVPQKTGSYILVFAPIPKEENKWRVIPILDSAKNFPNGGAFVANFHGDDIRFVIGEHKGALRPAGMEGYAQPEKRNSFNMAPVIFQFKTGTKWVTGNENELRFVPGIRYLIFAYSDPRSGRPRTKTFQDLRKDV